LQAVWPPRGDSAGSVKIAVRYNSAEETMMNLGMPPNPVDYNVGLRHWETDGRLRAGVAGSNSHPIAACTIPRIGPNNSKPL